MISELILELDVDVCFHLATQQGCSACEVFVTSYIGYRRNFLTLYKYGLLLTQKMLFKAVRVAL